MTPPVTIKWFHKFTCPPVTVSPSVTFIPEDDNDSNNKNDNDDNDNDNDNDNDDDDDDDNDDNNNNDDDDNGQISCLRCLMSLQRSLSIPLFAQWFPLFVAQECPCKILY